MASSTDADCPVCGETYDERIVVERGLRWQDLYPGTPLDFFQRYRRRCSTRYDAERDAPVGDDECVVYFHSDDQRAPLD